MNQTEPGFECPDCNTRLFSAARCPACGWKRSADADEGKPKVSCWTCDKCGARSPGHPMLYADDGPGGSLRDLCSPCHFDERIRPFASLATDLCDADHIIDIPACAQPAHAHRSPHHHVSQHLDDFRRHMALVAARSEPIRL